MASAETIYCPYTDKEIPVTDSSPEHIIPLALGGMNSFTLPVSREFNSRMGSEIDGALANDFLVMTNRDKHAVKGHSSKQPEYIVKHATDADTGAPVQVTISQRRGFRVWSPREQRDLTGQGKKVSISINLDIHLALRFTAKVALSAGYCIYGDLFRRNVKHDELRTIMNYRPDEVGESIFTMRARVDHRFREDENDNARLRRAICQVVAPGSIVALVPSYNNFSVVVGVLGEFMGMVSVPAVTSAFPRTDEFRWGQVIILDKPIPIRDSFRRMLQKMAYLDPSWL